MPKCRKCKKTKQQSKFGKWKYSKSGYKSICKECNNEIDRIKYELNKEHRRSLRRKSARNRRNNLRLKIVEFLKNNPCKICGESRPEALDFDHIDPLTKISGIADMMSYGWNKIKKEIEKCDVICANCHLKRTAKQQNWYKDSYVNK